MVRDVSIVRHLFPASQVTSVVERYEQISWKADEHHDELQAPGRAAPFPEGRHRVWKLPSQLLERSPDTTALKLLDFRRPRHAITRANLGAAQEMP